MCWRLEDKCDIGMGRGDMGMNQVLGGPGVASPVGMH